jgi:hypothetical protein
MQHIPNIVAQVVEAGVFTAGVLALLLAAAHAVL